MRDTSAAVVEAERILLRGDSGFRFKDFTYRTLDSWSHERRVVGKAEVTRGEANPRFVVTSLTKKEAAARWLYEEIYCARGEMENRIKECQLDRFADRTATSADGLMPCLLSLLPRACAIAGQTDEALTLLDDALRTVERTGAYWFAAEMSQLKGQLVLRQGKTEQAEALYRQALSIAHQQEAKLWELRAAVSLVELRSNRRRSAEARDLLSPIYGWFTEGFETRDLQEAKAVLDEFR